jgi:hypothetical protein
MFRAKDLVKVENDGMKVGIQETNVYCDSYFVGILKLQGRSNLDMSHYIGCLALSYI